MPCFSRRIFICTAACACALPALAGDTAQARVSTNAAGQAIDGYDTHAYWRAGAALRGDADHVERWNGADWRFASASDAASFAAAPDSFVPQFGGFCTRAMSFGKRVDGDPEVWRIYEDGLYLFALPRGGRKFDDGPDAMIATARAQWRTLGVR